MPNTELFLSLCTGLGLAASCGLRVFLPMLIAGLAARFNILPLSFDPWLANTAVLVSLSVASIVEVAAFKIPILDNFLDLLSAPLAIGAGALMTFLVLNEQNQGFISILSVIAGASGAGLVHVASAASRFVSTKATLGTANPFYATAESIASLLTSLLAIFLPVIAFIGILLGLFFFSRFAKSR